MNGYLCSPFGTPDYEARRKAEEEAKNAALLSEVLAESTASDVRVLRRALAEIVVEVTGSRSYGGGCYCSGKGCCGHVPETMKIARAALGLHPLPDTPRVPKPPNDPKKKRTNKKKGN